METKGKKTKKRDTSTVVFEDWLKPIVAQLAATHGLKSTVSAGVFLFSLLTEKERKHAVNAIKRVPLEHIDLVETFLDKISASYPEWTEIAKHSAAALMPEARQQ